jgi:hypothetical protein
MAQHRNRVILYVNGVRETSFSTETYPSLALQSGINTTTQHEISSYDASGYYFDGYLSEFNFIDGQATRHLLILANLTKTQEYGNLSLIQVLMELMDSI